MVVEYKNEIKQLIATLVSTHEPEDIMVTSPPTSELGDLSIPCFQFAKILRKSPKQIAMDLKGNLLNLPSYIQKVEVTGSYLNIYFKQEKLSNYILQDIFKKGKDYGSSLEGENKTILVEHTSINPNASPHVGRSRNALIGDSIVRLLRFQGYQVETHYFVNDVGKQIAMLVLAAEEMNSLQFNDLLQLYVDINNRIQDEPELEERVFELLYQFETGNESTRQKFKEIVDICINGQTDLFRLLDIRFDVFQYESDYIFNNRTAEILSSLKKTGKLFEDKDGRLVLNQQEYSLPMKQPYLVLTRKDKTSLYPLRDISYTIDKIKKDVDQNLIILGEDQKLYHQQVTAALDLLGYKAPEPIHYSFVLLKEGKMSTRRGNVVLLEDFMKEAKNKVSDLMNADHETDEDTINAIAFGAIKYAILKIAHDKNVTFDFEKALAFEGDSGPYIQYCYVRILSILDKVKTEYTYSELLDEFVITVPVEYELIKKLGQFTEVIDKATKERSPNYIANYSYTIAKLFSSFYHKCSVLNTSDEVKQTRIAIILGVKQVLENAMSILGINLVKKM